MTDTAQEIARLRERVAILEGRARAGFTGRPAGWIAGMTAASAVALAVPFVHDYTDVGENTTTPREIALLPAIVRSLGDDDRSFPASARFAAVLFVAAAAVCSVVLSLSSSTSGAAVAGVVAALAALATVIALFETGSDTGGPSPDTIIAPASGMFAAVLLLLGWCATAMAHGSWAARVRAAG